MNVMTPPVVSVLIHGSIKFPKCKLGAIIGAFDKPGAIDKLGAIIEDIMEPSTSQVPSSYFDKLIPSLEPSLKPSTSLEPS